MSDLPVLASDYEQTIDRQREIIKVLTEALEALDGVIDLCPDDDAVDVLAVQLEIKNGIALKDACYMARAALARARG